MVAGGGDITLGFSGAVIGLVGCVCGCAGMFIDSGGGTGEGICSAETGGPVTVIFFADSSSNGCTVTRSAATGLKILSRMGLDTLPTQKLDRFNFSISSCSNLERGVKPARTPPTICASSGIFPSGKPVSATISQSMLAVSSETIAAFKEGGRALNFSLNCLRGTITVDYFTVIS